MEFLHQIRGEFRLIARITQFLRAPEPYFIDLLGLKTERAGEDGAEHPGVFRLNFVADLRIEKFGQRDLFSHPQLFGQFASGPVQEVFGGEGPPTAYSLARWMSLVAARFAAATAAFR